MKKLNVLQAKWSDAIRSQLGAAKGDHLKAASMAAKKFPNLRANLVRAANPGKRTRAVDEELPEDEEIEDEDELTEDEDLIEDADRPGSKPAKGKKSKAKSRRR
jgi:hypothetical protein